MSIWTRISRSAFSALTLERASCKSCFSSRRRSISDITRWRSPWSQMAFFITLLIGGREYYLSLVRLDDKKADVIEQMLLADVLAQAAEDRFADRGGRLLVAVPHRFGEPLDAVGEPGAIDGLGNAVRVNHHHIAGA